MILRALGPDALFYRALTPSWAHRPESGAGAALVGGRFNRPKVEARYLAATPEAALAEYQGESALLPPATVATYQVTAAAVVDFTYRASMSIVSLRRRRASLRRSPSTVRMREPRWVPGRLACASSRGEFASRLRAGNAFIKRVLAQ